MAVAPTTFDFRSTLDPKATSAGLGKVSRDAMTATAALATTTDQTGQLSAGLQEAEDEAQSFASTLIDDLANGKGIVESLGDAFGQLGQQLLGMAANQAIKDLFSSLFSATSGPSFAGSGFGAYGLFDAGGYTGNGGKLEPAGVVHRGEFVLQKSAVDKIGVAPLVALNRGYATGGFVGGALAGSYVAGMPTISEGMAQALQAGGDTKIVFQNDNRSSHDVRFMQQRSRGASGETIVRNIILDTVRDARRRGMAGF